MHVKCALESKQMEGVTHPEPFEVVKGPQAPSVARDSGVLLESVLLQSVSITLGSTHTHADVQTQAMHFSPSGVEHPFVSLRGLTTGHAPFNVAWPNLRHLKAKE